MKIDRTILLAAVVFAALAAGMVSLGARNSLITPCAQAQNLGQRVVSGAVLTEDSQPVVGATVFLKNEKTKAIRSYTSTNMGHYYFAQVNMAEDYDLWAEKGGKKSATKTVSSWDSRKTYVDDLKLK
ncbi:MAG: carboxypeptidase-like regulatory domain-containing protein [Terracidiphilus sp.]